MADQELGADAHHLLAVADERCWTHVRLVIAPDGGVARLRVYGTALPDPRRCDGVSVDLASWRTGGVVVASSDDFYGSAQVLNRPDQASQHGRGVGTRRRRDGGHDWVLIRLGYTGAVSRLVFDTSFYRYNASEAVSVTGSTTRRRQRRLGFVAGADRAAAGHGHTTWWRSPLRQSASSASTPTPTGGSPASGSWAMSTRPPAPYAGRSWWNALPEQQALQVLADAGILAVTAAALVGDRPVRARRPGARGPSRSCWTVPGRAP